MFVAVKYLCLVVKTIIFYVTEEENCMCGLLCSIKNKIKEYRTGATDIIIHVYRTTHTTETFLAVRNDGRTNKT